MASLPGMNSSCVVKGIKTAVAVVVNARLMGTGFQPSGRLATMPVSCI